MTREEAVWYLTPIRNSASLERYRDALTTAIDALNYQLRHEHPLTNADRIRVMSDEELAALFGADDRACPPRTAHCPKHVKNCDGCWLEWLQQPVKED